MLIGAPVHQCSNQENSLFSFETLMAIGSKIQREPLPMIYLLKVIDTTSYFHVKPLTIRHVQTTFTPTYQNISKNKYGNHSSPNFRFFKSFFTYLRLCIQSAFSNVPPPLCLFKFFQNNPNLRSVPCFALHNSLVHPELETSINIT